MYHLVLITCVNAGLCLSFNSRLCYPCILPVNQRLFFMHVHMSQSTLVSSQVYGTSISTSSGLVATSVYIQWCRKFKEIDPSVALKQTPAEWKLKKKHSNVTAAILNHVRCYRAWFTLFKFAPSSSEQEIKKARLAYYYGVFFLMWNSSGGLIYSSWYNTDCDQYFPN